MNVTKQTQSDSGTRKRQVSTTEIKIELLDTFAGHLMSGNCTDQLTWPHNSSHLEEGPVAAVARVGIHGRHASAGGRRAGLSLRPCIVQLYAACVIICWQAGLIWRRLKLANTVHHTKALVHLGDSYASGSCNGREILQQLATLVSWSMFCLSAIKIEKKFGQMFKKSSDKTRVL